MDEKNALLKPSRMCVLPLRLQAGVWFQKCYDVDCRGFRSEAMPLPPAVLLEAASMHAAASSAHKPGAVDPVPASGAPRGPGPCLDPGLDTAEGFAWHADEAADEAAMLAALEAACATQDANRCGTPCTEAASMAGAAAWGAADESQEAAMLAAAEAAEGLQAWGA